MVKYQLQLGQWRSALLISRIKNALILLFLAVASRPVAGQQTPGPAAQLLDTQRLKEIEANVLPAPLVAGPAQFNNLAAYYVAANSELAYRFEHAKRVYERGRPRPFRMVTLVSGSAGVGKTYLKQQIFRRDYANSEVCRFDIREVYELWEQQGKAIQKPDLCAKGFVLNSLACLRHPTWQGLYKYLLEQQASFYVIDSLDEIHPGEYVKVLQQVERFAFESNRPFVHVVVLGRGAAFRDYWEKTVGDYPSWQLNLYMLEAPRLVTTGDLMVSSWNYHCFFHRLSWDDPEERDFTFADFQRWAALEYRREGPFRNVRLQPANALDKRCERGFEQYATQHRYLQSVLRNLAGNGIARKIIYQMIRHGEPIEEKAFKTAFFRKWLERDTKSDDRPSVTKPEHLDLYLRALEQVAARYLYENRIDERGFFVTHDDDIVDVDYRGQHVSFPVYRVLNRSGLIYVDPRTAGARRYRFEPVWLHRLLVDSYNRRIEASQ